MAIVTGIMTAEWQQLSNSGRLGLVGSLGIGIVATVVLLSFFLSVPWALTGLSFGAVLVWLLVRRHIGLVGVSNIWIVPGIVSVGCMGIGLVWLRDIGDSGFQIVLWLMLTVWVTDILALFVGRFFRGPKLAPTISPNKTWAGLIGGILGAALWSGFWSYWTETSSILALAIIGGGTAVLAQLGDLGVSVVKRRFDAKDTGNLIPGHGGLLDRMDGFLGAVPVVALSLAISKGDVSQWP